MFDPTDLINALWFGIENGWKPALALLGFSGLIIILLAIWIAWDAITWRRWSKRYLPEIKKPLDLYYGPKNGRVER